MLYVMGHQLGAQGPQDQLEGFDQLEIELYLGQLEILDFCSFFISFFSLVHHLPLYRGLLAPKKDPFKS